MDGRKGKTHIAAFYDGCAISTINTVTAEDHLCCYPVNKLYKSMEGEIILEVSHFNF